MADTFSLQRVLETFRSSLTENKEVYIKYYIAGWKELVSFMNSLGNVFSFISKDVICKIQILENFLSGENGSHYVTIQSMVKYELENELVDLTKRGSHPESGCRTLLRLHRALRWLELFLERLRTSAEDGKTSVMCSDAYNESLAQHHPWLIRKAVGVAFCALPGRDTFFNVMNAGDQVQVVALLGESLPLISEVYQITEDLYAKNNLLELP
ncbi:ceramide-1-phosphate transfer protein [Rhinichthys klamathensis goyatoka]|uniref:ceramide-1-phosphate transfer protein n=1 Tax=Rhinichthys klamathensis goyatoka TaxID=3034132 RepID=UPI0024B561F3|nr:ceramide-1-phosphate transfer protein [Rhinichthys klamathensis goyatoka]